MNEPSRCADCAPRRTRPVCLLACLLASLAAPSGLGAAQSLIEGVDGWSDAVSGRAMLKWGGQRVAFPASSPRPASLGHLDSLLAPVSVHAAGPRASARLGEVLRSAEQARDLLEASGLFELSDDGGQGSTFQRDLYVGSFARSGAFVDATERSSDLDSARTFVLIDARLPEDRLPACTSQALIEAELLELDPAEAEAVRVASAAYFTQLLLGESCDEGEPEQLRDTLHQPQLLARWLTALAARQDQNRGTFLQNVWHFARQRTWEGRGLRGSPDLLEAIGKALELGDEKLEEVAGLLANQGELDRAHAAGKAWPELPRVAWSALPVHRSPITPALMPLDSAYVLIDLEGARQGKRLSIWSQGEPGVRWVLSATRLDAQGKALGTLNAPVRKEPNGELQIELDSATRAVLVSVTNLAGGVPDPDGTSDGWARSARMIVDRGQ